VPTSSKVFNSHTICEYLNRLFRMHIERIADTKLPIFIIANRPHSTRLSQEKRVELAACDLRDELTIEVCFVFLLRIERLLLNFNSTSVFIEDFTVLRI